MTKFEGCYLTNAGRAMVYAYGLTDVTFTRAVTGSGVYASKEVVSDMTELKEERQEFRFDGFTEESENCTITIKFKIDNVGLEEGYQLSEIGIYAKIGDGEEKLYCVAYAMPGHTEEVPANDGAITYYMAVNITTVVSNNANISVIYSEEHEWTENYINEILLAIFDGVSIEEAFYSVYTKIRSGEESVPMSSAEIESAMRAVWNGNTSDDVNALSSVEIESAVRSKWDGKTSDDENALSSTEISAVTG